MWYRFTSSGVVDTTISTGIGIGNDSSLGVALQGDGKLVLAGFCFDANSGRQVFALARYSADGSLDTGFHSIGKVTSSIGTGDASGTCVALQTDGRILVAGHSTVGGKTVFTVARYFGSDQPPIVQTGAASAVAKTSVTLNGKVNPNSLATTAHFEYGLTTAYGGVTGDQACGNGTTLVNLSAGLTGLAANTTYHYRTVASNAATLFGGTTYGADATFTTAADPPVAVTAAATAISSGGATLAGVVFPNGRITSVHFDYGLTSAYGSSTPLQTVPAGTGAVNVFAPVTGLTDGGIYHFRVVADNDGTPVPIEGLDQVFQANDPPPTVGSGGASALTTTSARVTGSVRAHHTNAQVFFDYGTDGVLFPVSLSASPAIVTGDSVTPVSADLTGLLQGVTYYFRIRAVSSGGTSTGSTVPFAMDILSGLTRTLPGAPSAAEGFVVVTLVPSGIASGWRFVGEQQWRPSGVPVGGLTTGDRAIEYRPVPGFIPPLRETVSVSSGGAATLVTGEYYPTAGGTAGGLTVVLQPDALANDPDVNLRSQWRLLGENDTQWRNSGVTVSGLIPGNYLVECKPLTGRTPPPPVTVPVQAGQTTVATLTYFLADTSAGTPPTVLSYETVTSGDANLPYGFIGQFRSDAGAATGFVVKPRVVATAAHVVFDDGTLAYVTGLQWLFQRHAGTYEPTPQTPRGFYVFNGYAAQRTAEGTPGVSTPLSQNLDAAAVYFLEDAGRGGFGGFLASDATDNEFLLSAKLKLLAGYPVDGINATNRGRMHATPPANVAFARVAGTDDNSNPYRLYTTSAIKSVGGNSGGPLCVQFDDGKYYPAAIYLGGSAQTVVRAIDSGVIDLFNRAEVSANGGGNNTSGGITQVSNLLTGPTFAAASIKVDLLPSATSDSGATWKLSASGVARASGVQVNTLAPGAYTLHFTAVPGFLTPASTPITLTAGNLTSITQTYCGIVTQPADLTVNAAASATFTVGVSGSPSAYQWRRNGVDIAGATAASYTRTNVPGADNGSNYSVVVTWAEGSQTSNPAVLSVNTVVAPTVTTQPASQTANSGSAVTFTTAATGSPTYQWQTSTGSIWQDIPEGAPYSGTTTTTLTIAGWAISTLNGVQFRCVVANAAGSSSSAAATLTVRTTRSDFNADGQSDILWRHKIGGNVVFWLMNGTTPQNVAEVTPVSTDWVIAGTGDFNADGRTDVIWRHQTGGNVVFWLMNGNTPQSVAEVTPVSPDWIIAGTGDFNGDGQTDIVWRHKFGGNVVFWFMNGTTPASAVEITPVSTDWVITATGDFNNDGKTDIVWRHNTGGNIVFWMMNGSSVLSSAEVTPVSNVWTISTAGDFNGDGNTDIVWRHNTGGNIVFWLMNGTTVQGVAEVTPVSTDWTIMP
ncbi:MAG TPA: FG-GAP-like repeat-containing protein [Lacunisphaera sp.]|nr:FG-GAP-like repeat-containing protein [Lacunisphaera sp.]